MKRFSFILSTLLLVFMIVFFGCKSELIDTPKNAEFKVEYYF